MTNTAIYYTLINEYDRTAYTHEYIFGFSDRGTIWVCFANSSVLPYVTCLDKASTKCGGGYSLRFKPNKAQKELLKGFECFPLCSEEFFDTAYEACKYNRGEVFEKLVTEHFGQTWVKDNVPYTEDGDLTVNGIAYQIKYQKATFCNESILGA